ncbi:MAG: hypothetical protein ACD_79C00332G0011 [uncultured bacterium]|nr:MAG: hypothetical protein ACD_79C00332G0011 [uncultured bacterium]
MKINIKEIKEALGSELIEIHGEDNFVLNKVSIDSRNISNGDFYCPILGSNHDGHDYINDSLAKGAKGFFYSKEISGETFNRIKTNKNFAVQVKDTLRALQWLSGYVRRKFNPKVIAITGSNGKTTTKEMLGSVLSKSHKTVISKKSFNNHIGVPLTLLEMNEHTEFVVVEMGMNHIGEIHELMQIAKPDIGIILNISCAHIGNFKNFEELVEAKSEMGKDLKKDGLLLLNSNLKGIFKHYNDLRGRIYEFGSDKSAYCRYEAFAQNSKGVEVNIIIDGVNTKISYPGLGTHNAENIAAVCACASFLKISLKDIESGISSMKTPSMRMELKVLKDGLKIINDAYNANPSSFSAAIKTFDLIPCNGRKIMVVGEMKELGGLSKKYHEELAHEIDSSSVDEVYGIGENTRFLVDMLKNKPNKYACYFSDKDELYLQISKRLKNNDIVLLKGSRANGLESIEKKLTEERMG